MTEKVLCVEFGSHSALGASSFDRWSHCAGSIRLTRELGSGARGGSEAADEGTAAHFLAARCLREKVDAFEYLGYTIEVGERSFEVDCEMADGVQLYLDFIWEKLRQYPTAILRIEFVMASVLDEDAWGTADVSIEVPGVLLIIVDLKYGRGVVVEPDSGQLRYYGYLAVENRDDSAPAYNLPVEMYVVQPRIPHPRGLIRGENMRGGALNHWFREEALTAMDRTRDPEAPLEVGEWCRFCPARDKCPALRKEVTDFRVDLEPAYLTGEELGALLDRKSAIMKAFEDYEAEAFKRAMRGLRVAGQKIVRKKANRAWPAGDAVEKAAEELWGEKAFTEPIIKSPAQMEKLRGGKPFTKQWAHSPKGGLTLAPEGDKREEVILTAEEMFGAIEDHSAT